ncbi:MAG: hypothetical protein ABIR70_24140 [Bryobacteraceae bacterium]
MEFPFGWFEDAPKKERRRRLSVHQRGRLGEAYITGFDETALFYSYSIGGVQYETSQDISTLRELMPVEPERLLGVANMKYMMNNPGNSILLCEEWCGLRAPQQVK